METNENMTFYLGTDDIPQEGSLAHSAVKLDQLQCFVIFAY